MITKEAVLNKMLREIQMAQTNKQDEKVMIEHVKNVQLLSELILESLATIESQSMYHSVSEQTKVETVRPNTISQVDDVSIKDDGTSIFDF